MSTSDQPETPPLTRRQLREIRHTGSTPVLSPEDIAQHEATSRAPEAPLEAERARAESARTEDDRVSEEALVEGTPAPNDVAPGAQPTEQPVASEAFADPAIAPLTRRQAREHERIRTASVPIISPDDAHAVVDGEPAVPVEAPLREESVSAPHGVIAEVTGLVRPSAPVEGARPAAVVNPHFGSGLLSGETPVVELPPSFDQLISRTGSMGVSSSTPNALILSQTPAVAPLGAPVTATGEVLITGTFDLPEGLGSVGHAPGLHDGKEADAVLIDGELPAASSPTPIAASAAISQVRNDDEIIRPPAPEKGGRLLVALALTAGALLVTVAGLLVLAFTTGAF